VIPDRLIFLWTGTTFPYFARLAVESALLVEPDAEIEVHVFGRRPDGAPHLEALRGLERVRIVPIALDTVFDDLEVDPAALRSLYARIPTQAVSARANLLRYAVLARRGGIYLDTDILLLRGLGDLRRARAFAGCEHVLSIDGRRVAGERSPDMLAVGAVWAAAWAMRRFDAELATPRLEPVARRLDIWWQAAQLNNAVIGAAPGASFVRRLLTRALEVDPTIRYRLGPTLIDEVAREDPTDVMILPPDTFYPVPPSYSFRFFRGALKLPPETRLMHVVSSNHRALLDALDEDTLRRRAGRGLYYTVGASVADAARALPRRRIAA